MKKVVAAICDEEELYCSQLLGYLQENKKETLEVAVYSKKENLKEDLKKGEIKIALMTEDFFCPEILEINGVTFVVFSEGAVSGECSSYPYIFKYQKIERVLRELLTLAGECLLDVQVHSLHGKNRRVTAFYSPHQDAVQMYLTMGYARFLAGTKRVLYLNLMECAGFEGLFGEEYKENIGDFLFYLRQKEKNLKIHFESMLYQFGNVDYIPPVFFGEILQEAESRDYLALLDWVVQETEYEDIILDFGGMVPGFFEMLEKCSKIYCLTREDYGAKSRLQQFLQCVEQYGEAALLERVKVLPIAVQCVISQGTGNLMQELEWGELGDYIRMQFMGEIKVDGTDE